MRDIAIAVLDNSDCRHQCRVLAEELSLPVVEDQQRAELMLVYDSPARLGLIESDNPRTRPFFVELKSGRQNFGKDPLMRAIGHHTGSVVDCTAGWGSDAAHVARHNIRIDACECHPIVYALVANGLARCGPSVVRSNLTLRPVCAGEYLNTLQTAPDVIYLDPMYPPRPGSASPKRALQLLQRIHHLIPLSGTSDIDQRALLTQARGIAKHRVVVKRPRYAAPISEQRSGEIETKLVRFDLYPPL